MDGRTKGSNNDEGYGYQMNAQTPWSELCYATFIHSYTPGEQYALAKGKHFFFFSNEKYKQKFGIDNPNMALLKELQDLGVKITLCGQAMHFQKAVRENFIPGIKVSLTSQTVISYYQLKNYVFSDLSLRD